MYTIIICDDEAAIREGLSRYIAWNEIGFQVSAVCENGEQVLKKLSEQPVDVLLCDIRMPGITGLDIARYIFEHHLHTTVVLLSAYRDFEYAQSALEWGVRHYIVKSTRFADLVEKLTKLRLQLDQQKADIARQTADYSDHSLITQAIKYMEANLQTATLETVAAYLHRSPAHVSRYFRQHSSQGFSEVLTKLKMETAAGLLRDMRIKTYEVSERVGYASPKSFTRTFISYYGISPREYRNQYAEGNVKKP